MRVEQCCICDGHNDGVREDMIMRVYSLVASKKYTVKASNESKITKNFSRFFVTCLALHLI